MWIGDCTIYSGSWLPIGSKFDVFSQAFNFLVYNWYNVWRELQNFLINYQCESSSLNMKSRVKSSQDFYIESNRTLWFDQNLKVFVDRVPQLTSFKANTHLSARYGNAIFLFDTSHKQMKWRHWHLLCDSFFRLALDDWELMWEVYPGSESVELLVRQAENTTSAWGSLWNDPQSVPGFSSQCSGMFPERFQRASVLASSREIGLL